MRLADPVTSFFVLLLVVLPFFHLSGAERLSSRRPDSVTAEQLSGKAMALERAGQTLRAADAYEEIIRRDASRTMVLSRRLVKLYAEAGVEKKALYWARQVIRNHPDPAAYLAGVYAMLGNYAEAEAILKKELKQSDVVRRKIMLQWQLSDLYEARGEPAMAETALDEALRLARGRIEEVSAERRLDIFRVRSARSAAQKDGRTGEVAKADSSGIGGFDSRKVKRSGKLNDSD